jgi:predicted nuclease of predicted toxin-antitoxin system
MKIKLDENLPSRLVNILTGMGHDVDTVPKEKLSGKDDEQIWKAAQKAERFLITQDLDFSDVRQFVPGTHQGLMLVRLRNPGRKALFKRIQSIFQTEDVLSWKSCIIVVTEIKIRLRCH